MVAQLPSTSNSSPHPSDRWRLIAAIVLVTAIAAIATTYRDELRLTNLVQYEDRLRNLHAERPVLVFLAAFAIYVTVTALSLPAATALTLICGWYFRFWRAALLVSFASTAGATLAFCLSRYLLREAMQRRFGDRLARVNESLERDGPFYLFTLRLLPVVPFFIVNAMMGLTPIRARTFWWVSQLGMLPATLVWVYAGASAPSLRVLAEQGLSGLPMVQITVALTLLGVFPLVVKKLFSARLQDSAKPRSPS